MKITPNTPHVFATQSAEETHRVGERIAAHIRPGTLITLSGNLGTGKTLFTKGIGAGIGVPAEKIKSPTYTIMIRHTSGIHELYHWDLYRTMDIEELHMADFFELLHARDAIHVIEWAERFPEAWAEHFPRYEIEISGSDSGDSGREINIILKA